MTSNQRFDEHIKDQFSNYVPDVHPCIWENIAAKKDRKRPAGFWFSILNSRNLLIGLGVLLATGSGAWYLIKNAHNNNSTKNISETTVTKNNKPVTPEQQSITTGNNTVTPATTTSNDADNNSITVLPVNTVNTTIASNSVTSTKTTTRLLSPADKPVHSPFYENNIQDGPVAFSKKTGNSRGKTNVKTKDGSLTENDNVENDQDATVLPLGGTLMGRLIYGAEKISAAKKQSGGPLVTNAFGFLPDCPAFEKNAAGNKKYIEFYAGPDFGFRSFKDTGNSVYLQKRKESTKFTSAYSAGVRYTKVFNSGMSIRGGINYSQINEKFTYVQGNLVQVTYIIDANGDTTGSYITTGTRYKTTHNKYRSIDIPLMVGYEVGNGRLHANINAGPVINVYSWQRGEVLDTLYQPVTITTGKGSSPYQYKANAGIGFMGAVSIYYKLNDKVHVMAEPYYRHNFSQMNKENLTLKQKYNTVGIRVGIRVDLR
jgi:hypothetical protein